MLEQRLINALTKRESVHVKAGGGSGKTTLLKGLREVLRNCAYTTPASKKKVLVKIAEAAGVETSKKNTSTLLNDVMEELQNNTIILLVDDSDSVTRSVRFLLEKLLSHGLLIITIGEDNFLCLPEELMPQKSDKELEEVIGDKVRPSVARLIARECSTPKEAVLAARKAGYNDLSNKEKIHSFIERIRVKKTELMPVWSAGVIITLLLSMRYYFYMQREYQAGYTLALIAYALRALNGLRRR
ncbi:hypothetical protein GF352_04145 [archaeon]|nr:hypothetical protein [archaeon]